MADLKTYNEIDIGVLWSSPNPGYHIRRALTNTMANVSMQNNESPHNVSKGMLRFLFNAEHSSVIEHAVISFMICGVSRAFLSQITRHRMCSFTSSSQHYQDYSSYPLVVHQTFDEGEKRRLELSVGHYDDLIEAGIPREEARMVLPNASAVNIQWTINARSLHNFFRIRSCLRNVAEMLTFCNRLFPLVRHWWPEYADILGPPCYTDGKCNQGVMSCGEKWNHFEEF